MQFISKTGKGIVNFSLATQAVIRPTLYLLPSYSFDRPVDSSELIFRESDRFYYKTLMYYTIRHVLMQARNTYKKLTDMNKSNCAVSIH